ncbi:MAG: hypothetical protein GY906_33810 [bacterium]|nr:hypothetical protein [bacterium]
MFDSILSSTALPNIHPAVVHYPIALLTLAFGLDLACIVARRQTWLDRAATLFYVVGTVSACLAYISGQRAAALMIGASGAAQVAMYDHEDIAKITLITFAVVASLRLIVTWQGRRDKAVKVGTLRVFAVVLALCGQVLILLTADRGGELVFRHGLGVTVGQTTEDVEDDEELLEP